MKRKPASLLILWVLLFSFARPVLAAQHPTPTGDAVVRIARSASLDHLMPQQGAKERRWALEGSPKTQQAPKTTAAPAKKTSDNFALRLAASLLVPLLIAAAVTLTWRSQMKTACEATDANKYVADGSLQFTEQRDEFLYQEEKRTPIEPSK
ncbi:hypothetical protein ABB02_01591 [Clostridiaceae bacterium JG1575]|nr:hypothetical protein ABB02_01591 [Clostridiaceae bacterium JG1575]